MQIWIVENGQFVLYERRGECNQCGECCCHHNIQVSMQIGSNEDREEIEEEDSSWPLEYEGWSAIHDGDRWYWFKTTCISRKEGSCEAYDPETHLCTIWQSEDFKPVCRYWPWHPSDILPFEKCSFYFERSSLEDYDCEVS